MNRPETDEYLRQKIAELRGSVSQEAVADALGIPRSTYRNWEDGSRKIKAADIKALAEYFGVTSDLLLGLPDHRTGLSAEATARLEAWRSNTDRHYYTANGQMILHNEDTYRLFERMIACEAFDALMSVLELSFQFSSYVQTSGDETSVFSMRELYDFSLFKVREAAAKLAEALYPWEQFRHSSFDDEESEDGKYQ